MTLAQVAYEAYSEQAGGRSLATGAELPEWDALPAPIREAWEVAILAVLTREPAPEANKATLFRKPGAGFMTGRRLYAILSKFVELPACESLMIEAGAPDSFVKITTTCVVRSGGVKAE